MTKTPFYHETISLPTGHKVQLLGILHADIFPLGRKTVADLREELKEHEGPILAEKANKRFLPKEFVSRTISLDDESVLNRLGDNFFSRFTKKELTGLLFKIGLSDFRRFFFETVPGLKRYSLEGDEKKARVRIKDLIARKYGRDKVKYFLPYVTFRSFLHAKKILQHVKEGRQKDVAVVVGMGHAVQIKKFLENQRRREI